MCSGVLTAWTRQRTSKRWQGLPRCCSATTAKLVIPLPPGRGRQRGGRVYHGAVLRQQRSCGRGRQRGGGFTTVLFCDNSEAGKIPLPSARAVLNDGNGVATVLPCCAVRYRMPSLPTSGRSGHMAHGNTRTITHTPHAPLPTDMLAELLGNTLHSRRPAYTQFTDFCFQFYLLFY
jgi:hypothetical protein